MKQGALLLLLLVSPVAVPAATPGVRFVDVAPEAGLELRNLSGTGPEKWTILESTGAGACFLDREGDGDLDLYLVNGGSLAARGPANPARDALYDNNGEGRFTDVTARTGIAEHAWGGGCAVGDYDNDGDPDLYVTNFGPDALYRNDQADGTFHDVTAAAGVGDPRWGIGAVFFDADRDGDLDLYVANYLAFDPADPQVLARRCRWKGGEVMCGPRGFEGEADVLYRNRGDGTFDDASAAAGVGRDALYGMGVVAGDLDADGDADLFVANDSQENLLLVNDGSGRFADQALPGGRGAVRATAARRRVWAPTSVTPTATATRTSSSPTSRTTTTLSIATRASWSSATSARPPASTLPPAPPSAGAAASSTTTTTATSTSSWRAATSTPVSSASTRRLATTSATCCSRTTAAAGSPRRRPPPGPGLRLRRGGRGAAFGDCRQRRRPRRGRGQRERRPAGLAAQRRRQHRALDQAAARRPAEQPRRPRRARHPHRRRAHPGARGPPRRRLPLVARPAPPLRARPTPAAWTGSSCAGRRAACRS